MGVQDLQSFLEGPQVTGGSVPVDLLRIAHGFAQRQARQQQRGGKSGGSQHAANNKLSLVVDGECCLDRLYGGYFSDWACGGQWNRMVQFLAVLIQTVQTSHIELAVFFNGCLEQQRMGEWIASQQEVRKKINQVLKHINTKGTPPPKVWWTAPVCLRTCLRMALRHLSVSVLCTMDDHHQEVIAYCRENGFHGLMADDGEYAVFDPPRYFSSEHLKLTYKGSLETKEYILSEVAKGLGLSPDRFCILAALLGNYLLTEQDLADFYRKLGMTQNPGKIPVDVLVKTVAGFVKNLPSIDNLDAMAVQVFGSSTDKRATKLKQSVQYYLNGTKDGFLRYRPQPAARRSDVAHFSGQTKTPPQANNKGKQAENIDTSRFASETAESERDSLAAYNEATANATKAPQIVIEPPAIGGQGDVSKTTVNELNDCDAKNHTGEEEDTALTVGMSNSHAVNGGNHSASLLISSSSSSSSSSATSPSRLTPDVGWNSQNTKSATGAEDVIGPASNKLTSLPQIPPEVMRTASERHQKGLMSPYIYQILTQGEIKLPVLMEDETHKELPSIHLLYRPVRQMVYAILFNLHHHMYMASKCKEKGEPEKCEIPELRVKEWVWSRNNPYQTPDLVKAEQIGWGVPTIQRLWFGAAIDDKRRRLRAFLTCMRSDTPLMLNPAYVPQHLLVMASVLRYIMSFTDKKILRKPELDAFIAQAFSPELMNAHYLQELQLPLVTSRGVQLAALFMQGVETALLANDACGAPIPWLMCCPWLFFDGKLFHHKLARTGVVKNLLELCDHHIEHVVKVERMRKAVLEGLSVQFARPPLPQMPGTRISLSPSNVMPAGGALVTPRTLPVGRGGGNMYSANSGAARGMLRRAVPTRGGQLEIAGVVVGSWGPNYGTRGGMGGPPHSGPIATPRGVRLVPPQVTSVGGLKTYRQSGTMSGYHVTAVGPGGRPSFHTRGGPVKSSAGTGRAKKNQVSSNKKKSVTGSKKIIQRDSEKGKGRGMTVEAPGCGDTLPAAELLSNDVGGGGDESRPSGDLNKVAPGQFDDATPVSSTIPDKCDTTSSPKKAKPSDLSVTIVDDIEHKGQGDGSTKSVLAGVPTSEN
ncbi:constitutive coactivator of PPAR-gamma-like protein 1 homolog isoform X1 [Periplaneta americana]|uniref:constitutive coactivator of PPAR-gamma-like protein 1 homolog isoform X1 n=1 Tax=Periplaneta americana TaxID=6978 RepID=UPI0037E91EE5